MRESGFKCPKCGQTESFVASALVISGPIDICGYEYEPRIGHGLHYEIPDDAIVRCCECGAEGRAFDLAKCQADAWWKGEEE